MGIHGCKVDFELGWKTKLFSLNYYSYSTFPLQPRRTKLDSYQHAVQGAGGVALSRN